MPRTTVGDILILRVDNGTARVFVAVRYVERLDPLGIAVLSIEPKATTGDFPAFKLDEDPDDAGNRN